MQKLKEQWRQALFAKRNTVTLEQRHLAALSAQQRLINHPVFLASQNIACYFAQDNEFDCMPIMQSIWEEKKNCFLPVLATSKDQGLQFAAYSPKDSLCLNRYKISEPEKKTILPNEKLDLVLVPVVGFDLQGNRLGMGGGYYDRAFAFLQNQPKHKPYLIGLAYECQYIEEVPEESNDVPMDAILTEKRLYTFPRE